MSEENIHPTVIHLHPRPSCSACGREMVLAAIQAGEHVFSTFVCDCIPQPEGIAADIVRAREWDNESLIYVIELTSANT